MSLLLRNVRPTGLTGGTAPVDVAVTDGRIAWIGPAGLLPDGSVLTDRSVLPDDSGLPAGSGGPGSSGPDGPSVLDGAGAFVIPGLRDRHVHLTQWAIARQRVDVSGAPSAAAAARRLATAARRNGELLTGFGFRDGLWPDAPDKSVLDLSLPGVPIAVVSQDLHSLWLSSAALALIGLDHPTGLLREEPAWQALSALPQPVEATLDRWALEAVRAAAARGVTGILDFEFTDTVETWTRRAAGAPDGLPLRVEAAVFRPLLEDSMAAGIRTGDIVVDTGGLVTVGPCKVLIDGSLNSRTAFCHDPYPGVTGDDARGLLTQDPDELAATIAEAAAHGIGFAVHAIGDRANTLALDCFERAKVGGRIEHAQLVDDADLPRFGRLGVLASVQPSHAVEDREVADTHWAGRLSGAFAYRSLLDAGAVLELGSDAPVSTLDPWHTIRSAVTRTNDDRPAWHPEQALTVAEALAGSTGGRLAPEVGDPADLVLVDRDPAAVEPENLDGIQVLATVVAGRVAYRD